ncbi:MAG: hypothetical protein C7B44_09760 [Sulfobacillus thermosulfidooxidans]|jgi:hypothetical protein|nr:MAG: hypothetical protein C7B44_09760 [Sulfobacillus thermosulfidooxidans]
MLTTVAETFGHADVAEAYHLPPVEQDGTYVAINARSDQLTDIGTLPYMAKPGIPLGEKLLGGQEEKTIYFRHAPNPANNPNMGKYLTEAGLLWNAGVQPPPELFQTGHGNPRQTVYQWYNPGSSPFRHISRESLAQNPAAWWTKPVFDYVTFPGGQWGLFAQIEHLYGTHKLGEGFTG